MKKKKLICWLASAMATTCLFGGFYMAQDVTGSAAELDDHTMESVGDKFDLTETSYSAEESFVYTASVRFEHGQAAGLAFGASEDEYWVLNVDRVENSVKLLYFYKNAEDNIAAVELLRDWYIGNEKMTASEESLVKPKVATIDKVQLKVVVSVEDEGTYAEFYADNIRRFGVDNVIELNEIATLPDGVSYQGGQLGYNCFNSKVTFVDTHYSESDYTYYTEAYRQQYHYSQYAHWNNDPNGLVYYDGYYHLYYQHHPYANHWGDCYWGHARSKDLAHWELLPICLFPDGEVDGWGPGNGYMWSGSAMVYRPGMSADIDARGWFPNGNGEGLIAFYTRDGGMQDQVLMSSDDKGMTWTKRVRIPQTIVAGPDKTDCRDPKVFPVEKEGDRVTLWGMAVTGMATGDIWFMKSTNLIDWSAAGGFKGSIGETDDTFRSECPDLVYLNADDGSTRAVITLTARNYLVGDIVYDQASGKIKFLDLDGNDVSQMAAADVPYQRMDFGPDSYATQSFYIDDTSSEYYGKTVALSWFSGIPRAPQSIESGSLAAITKTWNGGGMTIPVEYGLVKRGDGYLLTQTPIVKNSDAFDKTNVVNVQNLTFNEKTENPLAAVQSRTTEILATIDNPNEEDFSFRINQSNSEYTEIGWTKEEGYFVDRTHTYNGGLSMGNYHVRYTSGAVEGKKLDFYILSDNGGVEVFCNGFTVPFYVLTFAAPYSVAASVVSSGEVKIENLVVNEIGSVWREKGSTVETVLYLSDESVELSQGLTTQKEVTAYATTDEDVEWSIVSGEDVVELERTTYGVMIKAKGVGTAQLAVVCGDKQKTVDVTVHGGVFLGDITLNDDGILSGNWLITDEGLVGSQAAGDGFILSATAGTDFTYSAKFDLGNGAAAALVFRADEKMQDYYVANYDNNGKIVKLWSPYGELARASTGDIDVKNIVLTVVAKENRLQVSLNGRQLIDVTDSRENAPLSGLFGLNVCATRAVFSSVGLQQDSYAYDGGALVVNAAIEQSVVAVYNDTCGEKLALEFWTASGRTLTIDESYFKTLEKTGVYRFTVQGMAAEYSFPVTVNVLPETTFNDMQLQVGDDVVIYLGNIQIGEIKLNGAVLDKQYYTVRDKMLTIDASALQEGENTLTLTDDVSVTIDVSALEVEEIETEESDDGFNPVILIAVGGGVLVLAVVVVLVIRRKRKCQ
ncbi:MAG: glycoside hydrolase family 32 protein [Clostridia bacterium]|nr:glycoside hydrolase family 32 protein [Clostridia bacterium]